MAKTATFNIQINGITESVNAVDALNKQLDALNEKTNKSSKSSRSSSLSEEEKIARQIQQIDEKREAVSKGIYQNYLAAKDVLKEAEQDQKQLAASERLALNNYTNTMAGMKQQLADLKAVMQTVDISDSAEMGRLTQRANEINEKLKEIEASYGQFGRNVGNYAEGVAEGMQKVTISVGGVDRTFASARDASRTLNNELKSMALNGQQDTEAYKELNSVVKQLNSTMNDTAKSSIAMDRVLDAMQSMAALGSVAKGASALLGFDDGELQKSIQKLVALQSVMQGIEKINMQLKTGEFMGGFLTKGSKMVDDFVAKLFGMGTASKAASVGLQTTAKAEVAVGTAAKASSVGVKVLSTSLKAIGIGLILAGIAKLLEWGEKLIGWIGDWAKGNADLVSSEKLVERQLDRTNEKLKEEIELIEKRYKAGTASYGEKMTQQQKAYADAIKESTRLLNIQLGVASKSGKDKTFAKSALGQLTMGDDKGVTTIGGFTQGIKSIKELEERWKALTDATSKGIGIEANKDLHTLNLSASDVRDELSHLEQLVAGKLIQSFQKFDISTKEGAVAFANFVKNVKQNGNEVEKSVIFRMADILSDERPELKKVLNGYLDIINDFANQWNSVDIASEFMEQVTAGLEKANPAAAAQKVLDNYRQQQQYAWFSLTEDQKRQAKEYEKQLEQDVKDANKKVNSATKKGYDDRKRVIENAEKQIADLKISLMSSQRDRELAQLKLNNERTIAEIKKNGVRVEELLKLQAQKYQQDVSETISKYDKVIEDKRTEAAMERNSVAVETFSEKIDEAANKMYVLNDIISSDKLKRWYGTDILADVLTYLNEVDEKNRSLQDFTSRNPQYLGMNLDEYTNLVNDIQKQNELLGRDTINLVDTLSLSIKSRINLENQYFNETYDNFVELVKEKEKTLKDTLDIEMASEKDSLNEWLKTNLSESDTKYNEKVYEAYQYSLNAITQKYTKKRKDIEKQSENEINEFKKNSLQQSIDDIRDYNHQIEQLLGKQPIMKNGFINVKDTKRNLEEVKRAISQTMEELNNKKAMVQFAFDLGEISADEYNNMMAQINQEFETTADAADGLEEKMKKLPEDVTKEVLEVVNIALDAANQIIGSIDEIQQAKYEKQKELIEKETEELEKQLEKQKELTQKYADEVNDIEDELKDSRGARRQFLIDQLNAQMEAQRESLAQEKKMEKERENLEERKKKLEDAENKRKKKVALVQAAINTALSISYAAMNAWPMPAVAMMAAAAAVGAAQIAAISAQKYADGGLLQGKSHKEGGIKVLGGQAEVEGGEYVTNKRTTAKNLPLLEYINGKNKKVELSDLIDFYSNKAGNSIKSSSPKRVFADGGQIPSLNTDLQFNSRLIQAMEDYSNRPTVVSVVDIIDRTSSVNNVRTLAGLN